MDDLRFNVLFNSIPVISGRCSDDNEWLCAMQLRLRLRRLVMSMLVSFVLSFFPRDVLDEILNLIGSVSEGFPSYSSPRVRIKLGP